jgi:hypothetical protein
MWTGICKLRTECNEAVFEYGNAIMVSIKGEEFSTS